MKKYFGFIILFLFSFIAAYSQDDKACNKVQTGTFSSAVVVDGKEIVTMIYRKKDKQVEENAERGIKMEFVVKWTSPCTYELSQPKVVKGDVPGVSPDQIMYVKIVSVTKEMFTAEVTANFFDGSTVMDFKIIK